MTVPVAHVEVLVEELSMEAALRALLPMLVGSMTFGIYPHQSKQDLLAKLPSRLRAYRGWLPQDCRIVVVLDRDNDNCIELKNRLEHIASSAQFKTRSSVPGSVFTVVNRIVIEELESWYFGDWVAVRTAYPRVPANIGDRARFRDPDKIRGGTWETFEQILQTAGYFRNGLRKIEAAKMIAPHWNIDRNTSKSFRVFCQTIRGMTTTSKNELR